MDIRLNGRTALITGGSKGLGLAAAVRMAASGANVAIVARGASALAEAVVQAQQSARGDVEAYVCDVSDPDQIAQCCDEVRGRFGAVDILLNNAGSHMSGPFDSLSEEAWRADIDQKLMSAVRFSREFFPEMKARGWGRILNTLNIFAKAPRAGSAPTSVSRAAQIALTKTLSNEGAAQGVLVNGIVVGLVDSDQHHRAWVARGSKGTYEEFLQRVAERGEIPMGRVGRAEEFANVACFLASDAASYVTGCVINVDGGLSPGI